MTVNRNFLLLIFLITSGLLLCTGLLTKEVLGGRLRKDRVMGIHLGATYSSVGVYKPPIPRIGLCKPRKRRCPDYSLFNTIEIVENEQGSRTMPSCVAFTDSGVLIGEPARSQEAVNPQRTICGITRLLGRRFDDAEVQRYIKGLTYRVVNQENKPYVEVKLKNGDTKLFSPVEILTMIIGRLKDMAEKYMGCEPRQTTVILQQGYFDDEVRRHIIEACNMVGLRFVHPAQSTHADVLLRDRLFTRPNLRGLVYDLGGSAFSAVLVSHDEGVYEITAAKRDVHLGGQTFDARLVDHFVNLIKRKYNKDISNDLRALLMLRSECEKAKIRLSSSHRVKIKIDFSLADNRILQFEESLTREMFEELNMDLFNKTIDLVKDAMEEGGFEKTDVEDIIVVGGSTEIPMIQHLLKNFFGRESLNVGKPNEALTLAATEVAGYDVARDSGWFVFNPLSVGIETIGGVMTPFVEVDETLPSMFSRNVTTYYDGQTAIEIKVFEGERQYTKNCHYLRSLKLSDLPPAPRGFITVEVTVEVYNDWYIRVTAEHKATKNKKFMTIPSEERYNTMEEIAEAYLEPQTCYIEDITLKSQPQEDPMAIAVVPMKRRLSRRWF